MPPAARTRNDIRASASTLIACSTAWGTVAAALVMPCPRQITTGRPRIAATMSRASRESRISTARSYTGTPPRASRAPGMSWAP
ncbi:hypothetical protein I549_2660 [Mycobacterium avium subsp. avium 2285 (R)]|nr:hypothetical protein I549_2660 [Mycobacterium avium subsp. avium 2285 (R)]